MRGTLIALSVLALAAFGCGPAAGAAEPAPQAAAAPATKPAPKKRVRQPPAALWIGGGLNFSRVEDSEVNCFGGQYGAGLRASSLYVRWTRTSVSYEARDHSGTCDALLAGDSSANDRAWTGGIMLGRSGLFLGAGPAAVEVERSFVNTVDYGRDHGHRYEVGYTTRQAVPGGFGFEVVLFMTDNRVRDYGGIAFSANFGT